MGFLKGKEPKRRNAKSVCKLGTNLWVSPKTHIHGTDCKQPKEIWAVNPETFAVGIQTSLLCAKTKISTVFGGNIYIAIRSQNITFTIPKI